MWQEPELTERFVSVIARASTQLPSDVVEALRQARDQEDEGSLARKALDTMLRNVELAQGAWQPICQDTGTPLVWIHHPPGVSTRMLVRAFTEAVKKATAQQLLRPNAVDPLTEKNTGNGAAPGIPTVHCEEWDEEALEVRLLLKGGGCENVGAQYTLPNAELGADRNLEGVRRCVLDAVHRAQGQGCAPGILGVCFGGDRGSGFVESKRQLLRPLHDRNPIPVLDELEQRLLREANQLGIGPMGFGGKTTVLGVKIGYLGRLPASYFVSVSYMCWANRRAGARISPQGDITWLD
ncbi:MAG: fumarate hydratase [Thermoanaerobaculum sp.]|nr:fumarate hydratase [Thermoanaerobaculum sp.]MDW7967413.1 fumarate hydratase [Thermoanaerobaculum sp.]